MSFVAGSVSNATCLVQPFRLNVCVVDELVDVDTVDPLTGFKEVPDQPVFMPCDSVIYYLPFR